MFDHDDDDVIENAYDKGYEEGQGNTGMFGFVRRINHADALKKAARKRGFRDGRAALMEQIDEVVSDDVDITDNSISTEDGF